MKIIVDVNQPYIERTIQQYGVRIDEIHYYHDILRRYINAVDPQNPRLKRQFTFRRYSRDLSVIYFYDPELKQYFAVPYRDTGRPPMSIWEYREARRKLEAEGRERIDENAIFEAYNKLREQEEGAVRETKRVRRAKQRRTLHQSAPKPIVKNQAETNVFEQSDETLKLPTDIKPFDEIEELY